MAFSYTHVAFHVFPTFTMEFYAPKDYLPSSTVMLKTLKLSFEKHSYHQYFVQNLYTAKGLTPSVADAEIQLGLQYG